MVIYLDANVYVKFAELFYHITDVQNAINK